MPRPGDLERTLLTMGSKRYSTDLSDAVWKCLKVHFPSPSKRGRPRTHGSRAILDAIFYVLKSGCPEAAAEGFPALEERLDGLITNDKFCFTRRSRLKLRPKRRGYPPPKDVRRGGIDET